MRHVFGWAAVFAALISTGLLTVAPARAQSPLLDLTFDSGQQASPGTTFFVTGTIVNPGNPNDPPALDPVFANDLLVNFSPASAPFVTLVPNSFQSNVPGVFFAGDVYTTVGNVPGRIFALTISPLTPGGTVISGTATILGGADENATSAISNAAPFRVVVGSAPEPGSLALIAAGTLALVPAAVRRRKMRRAG